MSHIGKKPIPIPQGVDVKIDGQKVIIKGPRGELCQKISPEIKIEIKNNKIFVLLQEQINYYKGKLSVQKKRAKSFWGLFRALLANMVIGVNKGHEKKLEIKGLGYQAFLEENNLILKVGFTNPVKIKGKPDIKFLVEKNIITVSGINKELVGQVAAEIRKIRPPDPYKDKGIRYLGEYVRKKTGKRVATTTA